MRASGEAVVVGVVLSLVGPSQWRGLRFGVQWRGRSIAFALEQPTATLEATLASGPPMTLRVAGMSAELTTGQTSRLPLQANRA